MSDVTAASWSCPACGRRVPLRAPACHCGMTHERAALTAMPAAPARPTARPAATRGQAARALWRSFPTDIKALAIGTFVVIVGGVGWTLFGPRDPDRTPALLGYVDQMPPPPPKAKTGPAFKLPWWR